MTCISILTDFGMKDGNVGVMKGVIWGIAPSVQISDLSHDITPQNICEAAFVLGRAALYFPAGTIHLVIVDPGVGTDRRALAAQIGPYQFVGPDNGVFSRLIEHANDRNWSREYVNLDKPEYWLPEVSHVFHGRDIFAPVAAHLATGVNMKDLGTPIENPVLLPLPKPTKHGGSIAGEVIYIDRFGSLITNIKSTDILHGKRVLVEIKGEKVEGLVRTFGERPAGTLIALFSSTGDLIISIVNGNASQQLHSQIGDQITVTLSE